MAREGWIFILIVKRLDHSNDFMQVSREQYQRQRHQRQEPDRISGNKTLILRGYVMSDAEKGPFDKEVREKGD